MVRDLLLSSRGRGGSSSTSSSSSSDGHHIAINISGKNLQELQAAYEKLDEERQREQEQRQLRQSSRVQQQVYVKAKSSKQISAAANEGQDHIQSKSQQVVVISITYCISVISSTHTPVLQLVG